MPPTSLARCPNPPSRTHPPSHPGPPHPALRLRRWVATNTRAVSTAMVAPRAASTTPTISPVVRPLLLPSAGEAELAGSPCAAVTSGTPAQGEDRPLETRRAAFVQQCSPVALSCGGCAGQDMTATPIKQ